MEDIIPIFILVLLMSSLPEPKAHLDLIADFIELDGCELESERRLLLNLSVTVCPIRSPSTSFTVTGRFDRQGSLFMIAELSLFNHQWAIRRST